jgi:hypothetical protein
VTRWLLLLLVSLFGVFFSWPPPCNRMSNG